MHVSRRSVLRNIGMFSAVQPLAALAGSMMIGCRRAPQPALLKGAIQGAHDGKTRILFQGPWLFSHAGDTSLVVSTFGTNDHDCRYGFWDNTANAIVNEAVVPPAAVWTTAPIANGATFQQVYKPAALAAKSVYLDQATLNGPVVLQRQAADRVITLPMPNRVHFAGRLSTAKVTYRGATLPVAPYVTTILVYDKPLNAGVAPSIPILNGNSTVITANSSQDLIFQTYHKIYAGMTEKQHIEAAFANLVTRVQDGNKHPYPVALTVANGCYDTSANPEGIGDAQLGIQPCVVPPPGPAALFFATYSNCAGGGLGIDCC
jgi:hypothetical protein